MLWRHGKIFPDSSSLGDFWSSLASADSTKKQEFMDARENYLSEKKSNNGGRAVIASSQLKVKETTSITLSEPFLDFYPLPVSLLNFRQCSFFDENVFVILITFPLLQVYIKHFGSTPLQGHIQKSYAFGGKTLTGFLVRAEFCT